MSWNVVYTSDKPHLIEIAKSILSEHAIQFVTVDKRDSMYHVVVSPGIELYVQGEDFMLSRKLLGKIELE